MVSPPSLSTDTSFESPGIGQGSEVPLRVRVDREDNIWVFTAAVVVPGDQGKVHYKIWRQAAGTWSEWLPLTGVVLPNSLYSYADPENPNWHYIAWATRSTPESPNIQLQFVRIKLTAPLIIQQPVAEQDLACQEGRTLSVVVQDAVAGEECHYQWEWSPPEWEDWHSIAGANQASYDTGPMMESRKYHVIVTDNYGFVTTSNPAVVNVVVDGTGSTFWCGRCFLANNRDNWADADGDGDVDQSDWGAFQNCYSGPQSLEQLNRIADCGGFDRRNGSEEDCDGYVNGDDLEAFMDCFGGPDRPSPCGSSSESSPPPDFDEDGVPDATDNCPLLANADQADANSDGVGDACDADSDGIRDEVDNCPSVANTNQADWDSDGVGNACDNCVSTANADQTDSDADGLGNACDNCPTDANSGQEDSDWDGIGDACETDDDNDGVFDTQDNCPTAYNPDQIDSDGDGAGDECDTCPQVYDPGQSNQDGDWWQDACDNCPTVWNYYQQDGDQDGVGNACDNCPDTYNPNQADTDQDGIGDACEGEGLMGMMMQSQSLMGLEPESSVSASFVQHGTGELFVSLPPQGGTVVVDLVITGSEPISGFSVKPAANASGVISVDASAWTQQANALFSLGDPNTVLPSYYDLNLLQWMVAIPSVAAQDQTPLPSGTGVATGRSLVQITGPHAGEVFGVADGLDLLTGPISVPTIGAFTTGAPMSGTLRYPVSNGFVTVVTLTLQVAGVPGTYTLGVTDSLGYTEAGETPMTTGTLFTITVSP